MYNKYVYKYSMHANMYIIPSGKQKNTGFQTFSVYDPGIDPAKFAKSPEGRLGKP